MWFSSRPPAEVQAFKIADAFAVLNNTPPVERLSWALDDG
jgi:hypothetical protein